jgi:hypothetical protein
MPRIQSITDSTEFLPVNGEVLTDLVKDAPKYENISDALDGNNAGINDIAHTIGYVMKYGSSDGVKLQAAKLASEIRGVSKGKDSTTINFIISDSQGVNLMGIFNPQR